MKATIKNPYDQDALSPWKQYRIFRAGQRKAVKHRFWRRVRRAVRVELHLEAA